MMNNAVSHPVLPKVILWDIDQTAEAMGLSVSTLYAWVSQKRIPFVKAGSRVLFDPLEIQKWIDNNKVQPVHVVDRNIPSR